MESSSAGSPVAKRSKLSSADEETIQLQSADIEAMLPDSLIRPMIYERCFIATLGDKRRLSQFIQEINKTFPLPAFQHLKRVRNGEVFLFPVSRLHLPDDDEIVNPDRCKDQVKKHLMEHKFQESLIDICSNIRVQDVPATAPQLKSQYEEAVQLWPCKFHEEKELERLTRNELLTPKEVLSHCRLMRICYELKSLVGSECIALVFDPSQNEIVSLGWKSTRGTDDDDLLNLIPANHSVMRAIDNIALRQGGGAWNLNSREQKLLQQGLEKANKLFEASKDCHLAGTEPSKYGPYLCTGYDFYIINEPCLMCSMAMVHSRVRRIFFHRNNVDNGALGGGNKLKLHSVKELNHHYQVFRVNKEILNS